MVSTCFVGDLLWHNINSMNYIWIVLFEMFEMFGGSVKSGVFLMHNMSGLSLMLHMRN